MGTSLPAGHSDRALRWQILGRDVRPATLFLATLTVVNIGDSGVLQDLLLRRRHPDRPRGGERGDP